MKYFIIGDEDALLGFGLVGVDGRKASTPAEAENAFNEALGDPEVGIVLINENVASMIREIVDEYLFKHDFPLLMEIPGRGGSEASRPSLRDLANKAIGIKL